ncbi:ABC transporter ATP-binding protein/permease [Anaerococcus murdochii]|uniref:ABC transporter ATP-binding protein/permease n=1 Tax=Anaerococcus murdochii TaxID=411577 RepID=A0ABS7T081_9FIRM|nr:ABC transporter ATP-binding protein [Anaerococcus murdochii]MBZ2387172.1 ABC transporter ATP-binding protein/permease [Anaerococcus murdochii]
MKEFKFLIKKMAHLEPIMFLLIALYGLFVGIKPFLWIISPAYILENYQGNPEVFPMFFIGLFFISSLISFFDAFVMGNYRMRMNHVRYKLMNMITEYSLYLPYALKKEKKESEKISDAMKAVESPWLGAGGIMMDLPNVFSMMISIGGFLWIFTTMDLWVLITTLILTGLSWALLNQVPKSYNRYWDEVSPNWDKFAKLNNEMKSPLSKQDILIFDTIRIFKSYYGKTNKDRIIRLGDVNTKTLRIFTLANIFNLIRDGLIIYWLMTGLIGGGISIASFYVYFTAIFAFIAFNHQTMWVFSDIRRNFTMFKPFFKITDVYKDQKQEIYPEQVEIVLDYVSFKYPGTDDYVLRNINLKIKDSETIALVGENGAGKSTLALLLAGLYEPTEGKLLINGEDIKNSQIDYKKLISAVFQDSNLLPFSFKENILMSTENRDIDDIYKMTHLDEIINKYDKKDDQTLLRILDNDGVDLSGGQKQRLFLARAIAKSKAKLLILDEPTAQLDALNERELYMLYDNLTKDKSSIFISHRLASTKFCDRIIYLKDGKILANGTHDELMNTCEDYKDLYNLQADNYKEVL